MRGPSEASAALTRRLVGLEHCPRGSRWLVGVSGGADSVALLRLLADVRKARGWRLLVVHIHHGLRGAAADADARFVRALAQKLHIPFRLIKVDVASGVSAGEGSVEMVARDARIEAMRHLSRSCKAAGVLLGHTLDDQAETMFMRVLRGSGPDGLGAMRVASRVRGLIRVRPMLQLRRQELRDYLESIGQRWREDRSNTDEKHFRNQVRNRLIPYVERMTGRSVAESLARTARLVSDESDYWESILREARLRCGMTDERCLLGPLKGEHAAVQRRLIASWLSGRVRGVDAAMVERVRTRIGQSGHRLIEAAGGFRVEQTRSALFLRAPLPSPEEARVVRLSCPGVYELEEWGIRIRIRTMNRSKRRMESPVRFVLPADKLGNHTFAVRGWRAGDRMKPRGGTGSRKLKDLMTDAGWTAWEKRRVPVFTVDDRPVWVPGLRPADGWDVPRRGDRVIEVQVDPMEGNGGHVLKRLARPVDYCPERRQTNGQR